MRTEALENLCSAGRIPLVGYTPVFAGKSDAVGSVCDLNAFAGSQGSMDNRLRYDPARRKGKSPGDGTGRGNRSKKIVRLKRSEQNNS